MLCPRHEPLSWTAPDDTSNPTAVCPFTEMLYEAVRVPTTEVIHVTLEEYFLHHCPEKLTNIYDPQQFAEQLLQRYGQEWVPDLDPWSGFGALVHRKESILVQISDHVPNVSLLLGGIVVLQVVEFRYEWLPVESGGTGSVRLLGLGPGSLA